MIMMQFPLLTYAEKLVRIAVIQDKTTISWLYFDISHSLRVKWIVSSLWNFVVRAFQSASRIPCEIC